MKGSMNYSTGIFLLFLLLAIVFPFLSPSPYLIHILIYIFIWSSITTAWAYMGRFGLVSLCHGAFIGIPAYAAGLLFNYYHLNPWIGMLIGLLGVAILAWVFGYACFRFGVIGHYFAITTLVITELVVVVIMAFREVTGGRLGFTLERISARPLYEQLLCLQFESKVYFYYLAILLLLFTLYVWKKIDQSKAQKALKAIGDDEVAASCMGIPIVKYKTGITIVSAVVAGIGGVLYAQYTMYVNPISMIGVGPSLEIIFNAILGGMFTLLGPMIGTVLITLLQEFVRIYFGVTYMGWSIVGYAVVIILIIIFLPEGFYGTLRERFHNAKREKVSIRIPDQ
jgi:branched-chain amino acid transport system permease protein